MPQQGINSPNHIIGVIGLGYVGLPLALRFVEQGFRVLGFDIDEKKCELLNEGKTYLKHIDEALVAKAKITGRFYATNDFTRMGEPDALIICLPTPLNRHREPDLQYIEKTADQVSNTLRKGQLICLESTTYPGTTEEVVLPRLCRSGLEVGKDFFLAYSPEREDPGNEQYSLSNTPKVVGGVTQACLRLATELYSQISTRVVPVSSTRVAEASKLLENIYRAVNVALVNELKVAFDKMGIDIWEVIAAAETKPFGFQPFYPGPGLGGHCLPIDPFYLTWKAREFGIETRFIQLAGETNSNMPYYMVDKLADALNNVYKPLKGSKILILGVSYKKDVGDLRESPALEIMATLLEKGAVVDYSDPYFAKLPNVRRHSFGKESVKLTEDALGAYDAVMIVTDHSDFPYEMIYKKAALIVDTRNALGKRGFAGPHIIK